MRKLKLALVIVVSLLCVLGVIALGIPFLRDQLKLRRAQVGFNEAMAKLPDMNEFETVTIISGTSSMTAYGETCYYSGAYIVLGTSLPEEKALKTYVDALQSQGWKLKEGPQYDWEKCLIRGEHEEACISIGGAGWAIESNEEYQEAKDKYPTFIFVSLRFILPQREGC
jgi:hypothetical protein